MNNPTILNTDFYQIAMTVAYIAENKGNEISGFEGFFRHPKKDVTNDNIYYFNGKKRIDNFMKTIEKEIKEPNFFESFWKMAEPKIPDYNRSFIFEKVKSFFNRTDFKMDYVVIEDNSILHPYLPFFQFKGERWIGQMIETMILSLVNGSTAYATRIKNKKDENSDKGIVMPDSIFPDTVFNADFDYIQAYKDRAKEYREATSKVLIEAGFRRAPSFAFSLVASRIAIEYGWESTSNTGLFNYDNIQDKYVNGTMAHAFVMSFPTEKEAFKAWERVYGKSTYLLCTYDVVNAMQTLIDENIEPGAVRIDVNPLDELAITVREMLDNNGWEKGKIIISGDITPEMLKDFEQRNIPFDGALAGTKYVNTGRLSKLNSGFVYKMVYSEDIIDGKTTIRYPVKKASGKSSIGGFKDINYIKDNDEIKVISGNTIGNIYDKNITKKSKVTFT